MVRDAKSLAKRMELGGLTNAQMPFFLKRFTDSIESLRQGEGEGEG